MQSRPGLVTSAARSSRGEGSGVAVEWIFEGPLVRISRWRCPPERDRQTAERSHPTPVIVFLHSGNFRVHSSQPIGLLDCTRVAFFNSGVPFRTTHPHGGGDRGSELAVSPDVLAEILRRYDAAAGERPESPFSTGWGPCAPRAFLWQRALVRRILAEHRIDGLEIEELALTLADRLVRAAAEESGRSRTPPLRLGAREHEEVDSLRGHLSSHPGRRHRLDALARHLESTPFRLCRSFRAVTGMTIHRYLTRVRLQQAIGLLAEGFPDLSDLASELGFSSHSHFTAVFRRRLGETPEAVRRAARAGRLAELGRRLSSIAASARN
ncbi:MAG TPA: AraC family transcriptional regulator [Thermoanaerobaculia bacterium]|nr:AraC family transcriptional regulator [Thermoanaerobaculia bacterium]